MNFSMNKLKFNLEKIVIFLTTQTSDEEQLEQGTPVPD